MIPAGQTNAKAAPTRRPVKASRAQTPVVETNAMERIKISSIDDPKV